MLCSFGINIVLFFFFNDTATTEIYTLSLHDALPIYQAAVFATAKRYADFHIIFATKTQRHKEETILEYKTIYFPNFQISFIETYSTGNQTIIYLLSVFVS